MVTRSYLAPWFVVLVHWQSLYICPQWYVWFYALYLLHYSDVIMGAIASQITSLPIVYLTVYLGAPQRKLQSSASLAFVRGIHRWPVNSPHKWPVTRKMFPIDDVSWHIMQLYSSLVWNINVRVCVMASWHGNAFCISGAVCEESTSQKVESL